MDSDIRLPDNSEPLVWQDKEAGFELTLRNQKEGFSFISESLNARLTLEADSLEDARERSQDLLAAILNALVWISVSMIRQAKLVRVVDWSPGKTMRDALIFTETPKIAVAEPILIPEMIDSAAKLYRLQGKDQVQSALRWFRLGVGGDNLEEQFTYFWFSLETAAEALKSSGKVASKCPVCNADLYCEGCQTHPLHRKFSADAIRDLIVSSLPSEEAGRTAFRALTKIRHTLMHGRRIGSIEDELPYDGVAATNQLAQLARNAILKLSDVSRHGADTLELIVVENADVVRGNVIGAAHVQTVFGPDANNPSLPDTEGVRVSIRYAGQPEESV